MPRSRKRKKALRRGLVQAAKKGRTGLLAREVLRSNPKLARTLLARANNLLPEPPLGLPR